jgi:hypothetical protein
MDAEYCFSNLKGTNRSSDGGDHSCQPLPGVTGSFRRGRLILGMSPLNVPLARWMSSMLIVDASNAPRRLRERSVGSAISDISNVFARVAGADGMKCVEKSCRLYKDRKIEKIPRFVLWSVADTGKGRFG